VENVDERDWNQGIKLEERPLAVERAIRIRTGRAPARLAASIRRSRPQKTLSVGNEWCKSRFFSFQVMVSKKRFFDYKPIAGSKAKNCPAA
jgi:hypothetical protein